MTDTNTADIAQATCCKSDIPPVTEGGGAQVTSPCKGGPDQLAHGTTQAPQFQPAKNPTSDPQFLQIVAKPRRSAGGKSEPKLTRVAFKVSRLMEFCSERELQNQTGHSLHDWPLVVGKEIVDNALDACEEAEVAPEITVIVDSGTIIIQDNAGGIDTETIESILDYTIRVSSREAYISPTRGAQGNALKTILAMGYVLDRKIGSDTNAAGITIIETRGIRHLIEFRVDHVNNQPKIIHTMADSPVKVGTKITIKWPPKLGLLDYAADRFKQLIEAYVSPTRGAQGNALKTILAMGYVLDREREDVNGINNDAVGVTFIESRGVKHRIEFRADHVTNQPKITHKSKRTRFAVHRPGEPAPGYARRRLSPATRPQRLLV